MFLSLLLIGRVIPGGGDVALAPYYLEQMQTIYNQRSNSERDSLSLISFKKEMKRVMKFHAMGGKITVGTISYREWEKQSQAIQTKD